MHHSQRLRYSRHFPLPGIGESGQEKLLAAKVLIVGVGGLGSPLSLYLAAAGVGTLGLVEDDNVELSNLQRQVLHETSDIGRAKALSARDALHDLNPDITVNTYTFRLEESTIGKVLSHYDLVADCSDNPATRYLLNDHCHRAGKTLVSAAVQGFNGQLSTYKSFLGEPHPCYRCLYPAAPLNCTTQTCADAGVLGPAAGVMGSLQAVEVIKELLELGESLSGFLLLYNALNATTRKVGLKRNKGCSCCG